MSGAVVVARVLLGEARFTMEPKKEECMSTCSTFRKNPVLRQGDARGFALNSLWLCCILCVYVCVQFSSINECGLMLQPLGLMLHLLQFN